MHAHTYMSAYSYECACVSVCVHSYIYIASYISVKHSLMKVRVANC